ncbi:MAG: hypothetical protein M3Y86_11195 [Verrucomicrobiota bacterium]|nr:hypothetical protein [Verrucomicrobiota bacterium]
MVLNDSPNDSSPANRITWTTLPGHEIKQEWASSKDGGKTWQVGFGGIYRVR